MTGFTPAAVGAVYADAAARLIPRYDALDPAEVLAPVADLLPVGPARVLDAGAGAGGVARHLAARGHRVTIEPVAAFRAHGRGLSGPRERGSTTRCRASSAPGRGGSISCSSSGSGITCRRTPGPRASAACAASSEAPAPAA
ncbi:hypothetical protein HKCCE2091_20465 [Rhodobacterales bacterium HKCCE2091]|nr:hypothetical protein [Rhodobacterales bacterium HKCCE2091]